MKKILLIYVPITIIAILTFSLASAQSGMGNVKGAVTGFDEETGTIGIHTTKGEDVIVLVPEGFDFSSATEGAFLHVKGWFNEDGYIVADWLKEGKDRAENGEGSKADSAFCSGRKEKSHPLAAGIEELYGFSAEDTMIYFCKGYGFGQIMLAIQTQELKGEEIDVSGALEARSDGKGWGQIWKQVGLVGKPGEASSPPGHLKRPDHAGPPEGKGQNQP